MDAARLLRIGVLMPAAELATDLAGGVFVDALAEQQPAVATAAMIGRRRDPAEAPAQERDLKLRSVADGFRHRPSGTRSGLWTVAGVAQSDRALSAADASLRRSG